jgi:hypothetical protein
MEDEELTRLEASVMTLREEVASIEAENARQQSDNARTIDRLRTAYDEIKSSLYDLDNPPSKKRGLGAPPVTMPQPSGAGPLSIKPKKDWT